MTQVVSHSHGGVRCTDRTRLSCGMRALSGDERLWMARPDEGDPTRCECYNNVGDTACVAICVNKDIASVETHSVDDRVGGRVHTHVQCPAGTQVTGCGIALHV